MKTKDTRPPRKNEQIRARKVRVLHDTLNEVINLGDALAYAKGKGLDLVEVSPNADPVVCRVVDYGKYIYEQNKKSRETSGSPDDKELKFGVHIDTHDFFTKLNHLEEFLSKKHRVKVFVIFRGRQKAHMELGYDLIERIKNELSRRGMSFQASVPAKTSNNITFSLKANGNISKQNKTGGGVDPQLP